MQHAAGSSQHGERRVSARAAAACSLMTGRGSASCSMRGGTPPDSATTAWLDSLIESESDQSAYSCATSEPSGRSERARGRVVEGEREGGGTRLRLERAGREGRERGLAPCACTAHGGYEHRRRRAAGDGCATAPSMPLQRGGAAVRCGGAGRRKSVRRGEAVAWACRGEVLVAWRAGTPQLPS